jgi:hypothetical protein
VLLYCNIVGKYSSKFDVVPGTVLASKMADVVCAQIFFRRKGTKPILQVTVQVLCKA